MATAAETAAAATAPIAGVLAAGVATISNAQTVTFTKYVRLVLPLDGFVFWLKADQVSQSALESAGAFGSLAFNAPPAVVTPAATVTAMGSLHYVTEAHQDEDSTYTTNRVLFTSLSQVDDLNAIAPTVLFIGEFDGQQFAFSRQGMFYKQTGLWHYEGTAVTASLSSQLIDDATQLDASNIIVSNSLPIWLALNQYMPLFPSYLVPENEQPPYAAVHIEPSSTEAMQTIPHMDGQSNQWQLMRERVRIVTYGLRNHTLQDYLSYLFQFSMNTDAFGLMNMPAIRDEKKPMVEMGVIAQKKSITLDITYYQQRVRNIAQQLILNATATVSYGAS